jgi:acetyl-CoA acetyltransferase
MAFPSRKAAIVGVYTTQQARHLTRSPVSLQLEAIRGAVADAGLSVHDIDGLIPLDPAPYGNVPSVHMFWAEQLGERPITFMEVGIASGALAKAATAVSAGLCEVAVLFSAKAGYQIGPGGQPPRGQLPRGQPPGDRAPRTGDWSYEPHGAYMAAWYAMWAQRYMHEFGVSNSDLAHVAVTHRHHATLNPHSVMGSRGELSVEDVLASRFVCEPLHLLDCAIDNDGGYAIVVTSADVARHCRAKPVWVLGGAEAAFTDFYMSIHDPWFPPEGRAVRRSADLAFEQAGITRDEVDVAGLYDCFTVTMLRDLEEMGFCKPGEAADYFAEGHTRLGGSMPCNTDGGLLSNSHNGNPSGMHTIEVVRQLRGECGARQVPNAKIGVSLAQGYAVHGQAGTLVMASD